MYALKNGPEATDSPSCITYLLKSFNPFCNRSRRLSTIVRTPLSLSRAGRSWARLSATSPDTCFANAETSNEIWSSAVLCDCRATSNALVSRISWAISLLRCASTAVGTISTAQASAAAAKQRIDTVAMIPPFPA